ncbi:asparagine synthase C-terminal domain-containing protein [archaeon]
MDGEWAKHPSLERRPNGSKENLKKLLLDSVDRRAAGLSEAALLFSGGVDSSLLALLLKDKLSLHCYCAAARDSHDWEQSEKSAGILGVELTRIEFTVEDVRRELPKVAAAINSKNVMKLGVALPLWFCAKNAGERALFFGMGTEELFAGYERHRKLLPDYRAIDDECFNGVMGAWERDVSRDIGVSKAWDKEPFFPYLDKAFVEEALAVPAEQKIDSENNKIVFRELAVELGLPKEIAFAPKKAAQYGSRSDKFIRILAKKKGLRVDSFLESL